MHMHAFDHLCASIFIVHCMSLVPDSEQDLGTAWMRQTQDMPNELLGSNVENVGGNKTQIKVQMPNGLEQQLHAVSMSITDISRQ